MFTETDRQIFIINILPFRSSVAICEGLGLKAGVRVAASD